MRALLLFLILQLPVWAQPPGKMVGVWHSSSGVNLKVFEGDKDRHITFYLYVYSGGVVTDIIHGYGLDTLDGGSFTFRYTNKAGVKIYGDYDTKTDRVRVENLQKTWKATWTRL